MKFRLTAIAAGILAAGLTALAPAAFAAGPVAAHCGDTLTKDAYLTGNLSCAAGKGVTIAGNLTLDLRGFRLGGKGGTGVLISGPSSLALRNGTVSGWSAGLAVIQPDFEGDRFTRTVTISKVKFEENKVAIDANNTGNFVFGAYETDFTIYRSLFRHNTSGISGVFAGFYDIGSTGFESNGNAVSIDTGGVRIARSRIEGSKTALQCVESSCTLTDSVLKNNTNAVQIGMGPGTLTGNTITGSAVGLSASGGFQVIAKANTFTHNGTAVNVDGSPATLTSNVFRDNTLGYSEGGPGAVLDRNLFEHNVDAIYTTGEGSSFKQNKAFDNSGWGIYAPQAVDLGGNQAHGNGKTPQCVGVVCSPGS